MSSVVLRSGLVALVNGVAVYFSERGITANVSLGWEKRTQQVNQGEGQANRVVFSPADQHGKAGKIVLPEQPGERDVLDDLGNVVGRVRALRTWQRIVSVFVWACDAQDPTNEAKQIEATDTLLNQTITAVHRSALLYPGGVPTRGIGLANVDWGDIESTITPVDRSFGRELIAQMTYRHPIFDEIQDVAFPANAVVTRDLNPS